VTPVDATNPAIDDVVAKWAATPGARGIRIRMRDGFPMDADHPRFSEQALSILPIMMAPLSVQIARGCLKRGASIACPLGTGERGRAASTGRGRGSASDRPTANLDPDPGTDGRDP
jgi:hypothetical protein